MVNKSTYLGVQTLEILEGAKNYNQWIVDKILPWISTPLLEIGAGTGNITEYLLAFRPVISDIDVGLVKSLQTKFKKSKDIKIIQLDISSKSKQYHEYFNSVIAVNVLEHIEDDKKALRNMHDMLRKNGRIVLLVPAKKFAYTKLDKFIGHYRRYEKKDIIEKLENAQFQLEHIEFFNVVGLASWIIRDFIDRKNKHLHPVHIRMFDALVPLFRFVESFIPVPMGISLIIVAKK